MLVCVNALRRGCWPFDTTAAHTTQISTSSTTSLRVACLRRRKNASSGTCPRPYWRRCVASCSTKKCCQGRFCSAKAKLETACTTSYVGHVTRHMWMGVRVRGSLYLPIYSRDHDVACDCVVLCVCVVNYQVLKGACSVFVRSRVEQLRVEAELERRTNQGLPPTLPVRPR